MGLIIPLVFRITIRGKYVKLKTNFNDQGDSLETEI